MVSSRLPATTPSNAARCTCPHDARRSALNLEIRILGGARAGTVHAFAPGTIHIGRHPDSELRLDTSADLEVSGKHAILSFENGHWTLRDAGSTNGTFLNGRRLDRPHVVKAGDHIALGPGGPVLEVRAPGTPLGAVPPTATIRMAQQRVGSPWPGRIAFLVIALLGASALVLAYEAYSLRVERGALEREREVLAGRLDSLFIAGDLAIASLEGERAELAASLRAAQDEARSARDALLSAQANSDTARIRELEQRLQDATTALSRQQIAASLDFAAIERANRAAVARVFVETDDDTVRTGTAFVARADGVLLTVKHLVRGADGSRTPRRIAVQFADSKAVLPARLLGVSPDFDLAALAVDGVDLPVSVVFNLRPDTLGAGAPVAVLGFPLGGSSASSVASPLVSSGVLIFLSADRIEMQGYGAAGASGSPIVDASGRVVAILYGGRSGAEGVVVLGVPGVMADRFLAGVRR
jgi:S1-C subfamily serine protease